MAPGRLAAEHETPHRRFDARVRQRNLDTESEKFRPGPRLPIILHETVCNETHSVECELVSPMTCLVH
jgi:hypothetical protein